MHITVVIYITAVRNVMVATTAMAVMASKPVTDAMVVTTVMALMAFKAAKDTLPCPYAMTVTTISAVMAAMASLFHRNYEDVLEITEKGGERRRGEKIHFK